MASHLGKDIDDVVTAQLTISIYRSGAMSVSGNIEDERFALVMLDAARDSVKSHHLRQKGSLLIPSSATGLDQNG